jgi:hypothetical protein
MWDIPPREEAPMTKKKPPPKERVPVSLRAVIQRINRKLSPEEKVLKIARSQRTADVMGWYYTIDANGGWVIRKWVDIKQFAHELGVLKPWEELEDDEVKA